MLTFDCNCNIPLSVQAVEFPFKALHFNLDSLKMLFFVQSSVTCSAIKLLTILSTAS